MAVLVYHYSPQKIMQFKDSLMSTVLSIPEDVELSIVKGTLESNQEKPLFLWVYHETQPLFVVMIHTKDFLDSSHIPLPLLFLGRESLQFTYKGSSFIRPYEPNLNFTINKQSLVSLIPWFDSFATALLVGFSVCIITIAPLAFIALMGSMIIASSALVFLLLRTFIPHVHFRKCLQAALHGTHLPMSISLLLFALFPGKSNCFIITLSLIFVFALVATYEMYSEEVTRK